MPCPLNTPPPRPNADPIPPRTILSVIKDISSCLCVIPIARIIPIERCLSSIFINVIFMINITPEMIINEPNTYKTTRKSLMDSSMSLNASNF